MRFSITALVLVITAFALGATWQTDNSYQFQREPTKYRIEGPRKANDLYLSGLAHFKSGDKTLAISDLDQAIEQDPKLACAYHMRGYVKQRLYNLKGAEVDLRKATELEPGNELYLTDYGVIFLCLGKNEKAFSLCMRALEINPTFAEAYFFRAFALAELGDYDGAVSDFTESIRFDGKNHYAYYHRAKAKQQIGDKVGARADLLTALSMSRNFDEARCQLLQLEVELMLDRIANIHKLIR